MNIIDAIKDEKLFRPFLGAELKSWKGWMTALRALYGLPITGPVGREFVKDCVGINADLLNPDGFSTSLFLTGRRSGKSRIAAVIGGFEAAIAVHKKRLAKGEKGVVAILAPSKHQATIVKNYIRGIFHEPSILESLIAGETRDGFDLTNGTRIEIMAGDWRTVRGFSLLAAIVDEACFFGYDSESKVRSDTELIRALAPGLATTDGKLVCISSPYATRGWCYDQWKRHHGKEGAPTLVWKCPSRTMNPLLPQSVVDAAMAEDRLSAKSEYMGEFREDVAEYLPFSLIQANVVKDRKQLLFDNQHKYRAFVDLSGGRNDDAALAIGHREERKVIIDVLMRFPAPFNPHNVVNDICRRLRDFNLRYVTGDNYAAEFVAERFIQCGIRYIKCGKAKSELYADFIPRICSREVELIDDSLMVQQFASLERRTRSGGRDQIDHPRGGHDDLANVIVGVADCLSTRRIRPAVLDAIDVY